MSSATEEATPTPEPTLLPAQEAVTTAVQAVSEKVEDAANAVSKDRKTAPSITVEVQKILTVDIFGFTIGQLLISFGILLFFLIFRSIVIGLLFRGLRRLAARRKNKSNEDVLIALEKPLSLYLAILVLPLEPRVINFVGNCIRAVGMGAIVWAFVRLTDLIANQIGDRLGNRPASAAAGFAPLIKKPLRIFVLIIGALVYYFTKTTVWLEHMAHGRPPAGELQNHAGHPSESRWGSGRGSFAECPSTAARARGFPRLTTSLAGRDVLLSDILVMKFFAPLLVLTASLALASCTTGGGGGGLGGFGGIPGFGQSNSNRQYDDRYDDRRDRRDDYYDDRDDRRDDEEEARQRELERQREQDQQASRLNQRSQNQQQTAAEQQRIADQQQERAERLRERQREIQKDKKKEKKKDKRQND